MADEKKLDRTEVSEQEVLLKSNKGHEQMINVKVTDTYYEDGSKDVLIEVPKLRVKNKDINKEK